MKFFAVAALFAGALAMPTAEIEARTDHGGGSACPNGLYNTPKCTAAGLIGLVCLDAVTPPRAPSSRDDLKTICAKIGQRAACVTIPILGQGVLCDVLEQ